VLFSITTNATTNYNTTTIKVQDVMRAGDLDDEFLPAILRVAEYSYFMEQVDTTTMISPPTTKRRKDNHCVDSYLSLLIPSSANNNLKSKLPAGTTKSDIVPFIPFVYQMVLTADHKTHIQNALDRVRDSNRKDLSFPSIYV
jgi:hypothetical protein